MGAVKITDTAHIPVTTPSTSLKGSFSCDEEKTLPPSLRRKISQPVKKVQEDDFVEISSSDVFESRMVFEIQDPKKAERITQAYKKHILPHLTEEEDKVVQEVLVDFSRTLGSPSIDYTTKLQEKCTSGYVVKRKYLLSEDNQPIFENINFIVDCKNHHEYYSFYEKKNPRFVEIITKHKDKFTQFFNAIATQFIKPLSQPDQIQHRITIVAAQTGGGHITCAEAMAEHLNQNGYLTTIVYEEVSTLPSDPLYVLGEKHEDGTPISDAVIFNKVFQSDANPRKARELWLKFTNSWFIDDSRMVHLDSAIPADTSMILVVAHHHPRLTQLAYRRNIPLSFIHTDYSYNPALVNILSQVDSNLVRVCVPTQDKEFYVSDELLPPIKMTDGTELPVEEYVERFDNIDVLGFPVRPGFKKETDPGKLLEIRHKLNIAENANVVVVMMGRNGIASQLIKIIEEIHDQNQFTNPIKVIIVCGKNPDVQTEVQKYLSTLPKDEKSKIEFELQGFLNSEQLSDYFNVTDVLITKPGGGTVGEAAAMRVFMLSFNTVYIWERPNIDYLQKHNLGAWIDPNIPLSSQISNIIKNKPKSDLVVEDWRTNLLKHVDRTIETSEEFN